MKILVAIAEPGRATSGVEMVRIPSEADCTHRRECICRSRWVSTEHSAVRWQLARVVEPPRCFTLAREHDTPWVHRAIAIASELGVGTVCRLAFDPTVLDPVLTYRAFIIGPN